MRRTLRKDDKEAWRGVSRAQRRRIARAVRLGEPLTDPEDAALAVRFAARLRHVHEHRSRWQPLVRILVVAYLALELVRAIRGIHGWVVPGTSAVVAAFWLFTEIYGAVSGFALRGRRLERFREAERRNRELLEAVGHPDARYVVAEEPRKHGSFWNRRALLSFGVSGSTSVCLLALAVLPVMNHRGSPVRLLVFGAIASAAIALAGLALLLAVQAWRAERSRRGRTTLPVLAMTVAAIVLVSWVVGAVNVLAFGA